MGMKRKAERKEKQESPAKGIGASEGRFAYEGLDRVIHERARLSVLTSLITNPRGLAFGDLKQLCALTDGNLNRHLHVLEDAELVEIVKKVDRNRSLTLCRITAQGRARYMEYLETLEQVVRDAAQGASESKVSAKPGRFPGLAFQE
jgi:DNA-binding MarR family transcriptional regulator